MSAVDHTMENISQSHVAMAKEYTDIPKIMDPHRDDVKVIVRIEVIMGGNHLGFSNTWEILRKF